MNYTIPMALADFVPVLFFFAATFLFRRDLYNKMSPTAFSLYAAGTLDVAFAGALKALYKLLYAAGLCDFQSLSNLFFPLQSLGFLLAGIGLLLMFGKKRKSAALAVAPPFLSGTFLFVGLMVAGLGLLTYGYSVLAAKLGKKKLWILFVITLVCCMGMGYLSSQDFAQASMNWIAEAINVAGQGTLLAGAIILHRAGLRELAL